MNIKKLINITDNKKDSWKFSNEAIKTRILICSLVLSILIWCKWEVDRTEEDIFVTSIEEKCEIEAELESQLNNVWLIWYIVWWKTDLWIFLKDKYWEKRIVKIKWNRFTLSNWQIMESVAYFPIWKPYKLSELKKSTIVRFVQ